MQSRLDSIDNKLDKLVSFCTISADPSTAPGPPIPVQLPTQSPRAHAPIISSGLPSGFPPRFSTNLPLTTPINSQPSFPNNSYSVSSSGQINPIEFSSAMGRVDQLASSFESLTSQIAALSNRSGLGNGNNCNAQ
jgi:hypothetical protein